LQPLVERRDARLFFRIIGGKIHKDADPSHALALLRTRREWPDGYTGAEKRDELPSFELIELHPLPTERTGNSIAD